MNRREFTASLGALAASTTLPFGALRAAAAPAAVPPAAYKWAQLIARGRGSVTPAFLARQLRLPPHTAQAVFQSLIRDGVLRAPAATGLAQAIKPMHSTGKTATAHTALRNRLQAGWEHLQQMREETEPLVNPTQPEIGCAKTQDKDTPHASPDKHVQEGPRRG